jgi:hypothetical protein
MIKAEMLICSSKLHLDFATADQSKASIATDPSGGRLWLVDAHGLID